MDNLLYDDQIDAPSAVLSPPVHTRKNRPAAKGKETPERERSAFAAWFSSLSLPELLVFGLASGLLFASPFVLLTPGSHGPGPMVAIVLVVSLAVLWWTRDRLRWSLLFRLAMFLTFLGGDVVLLGYLTDEGALADGLCVIPQAIAALVALCALGAREGRRRAVAEGLHVLTIGALANSAVILFESVVLS